MSKTASLLSSQLLVRNVIWNLLGAGLPLLVALWAIPRLINGMGTERYGLLTIIWMGVSYFSLFDLGIGRALTKLVAEYLGEGREEEHTSLAATGLKLMFALGIFAMILLALITPWLAHRVLNIPRNLLSEAVWSFWILSATLPFVISTSGQIGVLQAHQRFVHINSVRLLLGVTTFLGPALIMTVSPSLVATTTVLGGARVIAWIAYYYLSRPYINKQNIRTTFKNKKHVKKILTFGGWITVSNIISPLMTYFDRFVIGVLLTMTAVTYYTTPFDIVTRLWIIPEAIIGVLFPALTTALVYDPLRARKIFTIAARSLFLIMFPLLAFIILFAPEALTLWLGSEFANQSGPVLRWLTIGVFINCMARLPFISLQACGRPDLVAKANAIELIPYLLVLWLMIETFGITGAAATWTVRIIVDTIILYIFSIKKISYMRGVQIGAAIPTLGAVGLLSILVLPQDLILKVIVATIVLGIGGVLAVREVIELLSEKATTADAT